MAMSAGAAGFCVIHYVFKVFEVIFFDNLPQMLFCNVIATTMNLVILGFNVFFALVVSNCRFQRVMPHDRAVHFFGGQPAERVCDLLICDFFSLVDMFSDDHFR